MGFIAFQHVFVYLEALLHFLLGMIAECGGVVGYGMDGDPPFQLVVVWVGAVHYPLTVQENPGMGTQWKGCFRNDTSCGCYPPTVAPSMLPTELADRIPRSPENERSAVRGGMGAIRIKFVES